MQKNILDITGMKNTGVENAMDIIPHRARGYTFDSVKYANAAYIDILSSIFSAGGIYSTARDLQLCDEALYADKLISAKSRELMFTPVMANYGYGVGITRFEVPGLNRPMHFIFHQGAINGFRTIMTHIVNDDVMIVLLCNNFDTDLNPINNAIFAILYNQPYKLPANN